MFFIGRQTVRKILDWERSATIQKNPDTGCIPTGYEFLLKMARTEKIDFDSFQEDFDLIKKFNDSNAANFSSVAYEIKKVYPFINISILSYEKNEGQKKLNKIIELIDQGQPVLISLCINEFSDQKGWHIMPVIGVMDDELWLLTGNRTNGISEQFHINFSKFVYIHENYPGGNDIAFLYN